MRSGGTIKNLPHYLRVKPAFRIERGKTVGQGQNQQPLGFMDHCSPSSTVRIQFAMSKPVHVPDWQSGGQPRERPRVSIQEHQNFASEETLRLSEVTKY